MIEAIDGLMESFRVQWLRNCKSWVPEVMQIKPAGLCERYRELARRLEKVATRIEEPEPEPETLGSPDSRYRMIATGDSLFELRVESITGSDPVINIQVREYKMKWDSSHGQGFLSLDC